MITIKRKSINQAWHQLSGTDLWYFKGGGWYPAAAMLSKFGNLHHFTRNISTFSALRVPHFTCTQKYYDHNHNMWKMKYSTWHERGTKKNLSPRQESNQEKMRGQRGRLPVHPLGYVIFTKVIFRRAEVFVLAEVCLPRRPHGRQPRSDVWKKSKNFM